MVQWAEYLLCMQEAQAWSLTLPWSCGSNPALQASWEHSHPRIADCIPQTNIKTKTKAQIGLEMLFRGKL